VSLQRTKGIAPGQSQLSDRGKINSELWNATQEGGTHNGVLTDIEDFLCEHQGKFKFFRIRGYFGLGTMYRRKNFTDDLKFATVKCKGVAFTWSKRFTKAHFPSAVSLAKSVWGERNPIRIVLRR
jgi:hypothetical protein